MWIKKSLIVGAWITAAVAGMFALLVIDDNGGLDMKTFIVIGGLVVWYSLSKQIAQAEKAAIQRYNHLLDQVRETQASK
jgi:hypothetical protein